MLITDNFDQTQNFDLKNLLKLIAEHPKLTLVNRLMIQ